MELYELKYFLGVAETENLQLASRALRVSPASLSKAISRLEDELGTALFLREGRNIILSQQGKILQRRASEMVNLEKTMLVEIVGNDAAIPISLVGPETLLGDVGMVIVEKIKKRFRNAVFQLKVGDEEEAIEKVRSGECMLGIVTMQPPPDLTAKAIKNVVFQTCVGPSHPLAKYSNKTSPIDVKELLQYPFVTPDLPFLGTTQSRQSYDGWRDDTLPRKIDFVVSHISLIHEIVVSGRAVAYLPDYIVKKIGARPLNLNGCPYSCTQTVRLVTRDARRSGWLMELF